MSSEHDSGLTEPAALDSTGSSLTRRRAIIGIAGAATGLIATPAIAASILSHGDEEDDDKNDAQEDREDSQDDHDDDHDELEDDDDDAIRESITEGTTEVHIIDDDEDGYFPGVLRVPVGSTVTFFNDDDKPHTATGSDFDTGTIEPGDSAEVTFDTAGSFPYSCQFHPVMTGTIEVGDEATPEASPQASPQPAGGETVTVRMVDIAFDPTDVEVPAGSTVTWVNEDRPPHTATALDGSFDTGVLEQGDEGSVTFDTPGTYDYRCNLHPSMTGVVVVT